MSPSLVRYALALLCLQHFLVPLSGQKSRLPGHLKPFGEHMRPMGVTAIGRFSSPNVFYGHFVKASKPIHMKSALAEAEHPGLEWTDDYLRNHYGNEMVRVEMGKKEVRSRKAHWIRMDRFLKDYSHKDLYMVNSVSGRLQDLVLIPPTLQCGGYQRVLQEAVLWMGRGPLRSVLHYDELDNLLCVFDGTKDVVLIDQFYRDKVEADGFVREGHYSTVDMERVDMHSFPQFQNLPWHRVHLTAGDCIYIPHRWYHQVTSEGERSLAINVWFAHLWWFNDDDCEDFQHSFTLKPVSNFGFASPNEAVRSQWLEAFEGADDDVSVTDFLQRVPTGTEENKKKVYQMIDRDTDDLLSWEELYSFDIGKALLLYPDVFITTSIFSGENETETDEQTIDSQEEPTILVNKSEEDDGNNVRQETSEDPKTERSTGKKVNEEDNNIAQTSNSVSGSENVEEKGERNIKAQKEQTQQESHAKEELETHIQGDRNKDSKLAHSNHEEL